MFRVSALLLTAVQSPWLLFHCGHDRITELSIHVAQQSDSLALPGVACQQLDASHSLTDRLAEPRKRTETAAAADDVQGPIGDSEYGRGQRALKFIVLVCLS